MGQGGGRLRYWLIEGLKPNRKDMRISILALAIACWTVAPASAAQTPCGDSLTQGLAARASDAPGGRAFAQTIRGLDGDERELRIEHELKSGNIPKFLRRLVPIRLQSPAANGEQADVIICAAPDYLAIGSDKDFLLIPMRLATALSIATDAGFTLPTRRMVDAIYAQAAVHFAPQPLPAGDEMRSTEYSLRHNELIDLQRATLDVPLGTLIAGDKKDMVLTNRLRGHLDRVAIYGWHRMDGKPIQPLSTVHGWRYADYSHGVRLISTKVFVDGLPRSIFDALQDRRLASALSEEGGIADIVGLIESLSARAHSGFTAVLQTLPRRLP